MDGKTKRERMMDSLENNVDSIFDKCCDDLEAERYQLTHNTFNFNWSGERLYILDNGSSQNFINCHLDPKMVHNALMGHYRNILSNLVSNLLGRL